MSNASALEVRNLSVGTRVYERLNFVRRCVTSYYKSRMDSTFFRDVKTYCMFIGHARSGGSIIGALLDAHPNVVLADEVDALQYVTAGLSREQIYYIVLAKSQRQARAGRRKAGRDGKVYSYWVPGQWQGRFNTLQVIGDSKAGISTQRFAHNPALFQHLQNIMKGVNVKVIHVFRNPYDTVSTMILRGGRTFENAIERYFCNCKTIADLRKRISSSDIFTVRHEEFVDHPDICLDKTCNFLGIQAPPDYLSACASIVYKSPAKSRHKVQWNPELIEVVKRKIDQYDFLVGYSYEN
jgi:Sulfotransferase family